MAVPGRQLVGGGALALPNTRLSAIPSTEVLDRGFFFPGAQPLGRPRVGGVGTHSQGNLGGRGWGASLATSVGGRWPHTLPLWAPNGGGRRRLGALANLEPRLPQLRMFWRTRGGLPSGLRFARWVDAQRGVKDTPQRFKTLRSAPLPPLTTDPASVGARRGGTSSALLELELGWSAGTPTLETLFRQPQVKYTPGLSRF